MFIVHAWIFVEKVDILSIKTSRRAIVIGRNPVEISILPVSFIEKRKLPFASNNINMSWLNSCTIYHFVVVISMFYKVRNLSTEEIEAWMNWNGVLFKISKKVDYILKGRFQRKSMSHNFISVEVDLILRNT